MSDCIRCKVLEMRLSAYVDYVDQVRHADGSGEFPDVTARAMEDGYPALKKQLAEIDKYADAMGVSR